MAGTGRPQLTIDNNHKSVQSHPFIEKIPSGYWLILLNCLKLLMHQKSQESKMSKKKSIEVDWIPGKMDVPSGHQGVVTKEELVAMIVEETGISEYVVRESIRLYAEYLDSMLEKENLVYVETPDNGPDMLIRKVDIN